MINNLIYPVTNCFARIETLAFMKPDFLVIDLFCGGVLAYIKEDLHPTVQDDLSTNAELLWLKVYPDHASELLVGVCYRPEAAGDRYIDTVCESINRIGTQDVILVGDFNIDWCNDVAQSSGSDRFLNCVKDNFLQQIIDVPTKDKYINDIVLVGNSSLVQDWSVGEHFGTSDHKIIRVELQLVRHKLVKKERNV